MVSYFVVLYLPRGVRHIADMACHRSFSPFVGFGLFIYGWTAFYRAHWIVPIIGTSVIGIGAFFILVCVQ